MKINYCINLGDYYSKTFNTLYIREIFINQDNISTVLKDDFEGYLNYKLFDEEDEKRAKNEARELFQNDLNAMIDNIVIREEVNKSLNIIRSDFFIGKIELLGVVEKIKGQNFTMTTTITR